MFALSTEYSRVSVRILPDGFPQNFKLETLIKTRRKKIQIFVKIGYKISGTLHEKLGMAFLSNTKN